MPKRPKPSDAFLPTMMLPTMMARLAFASWGTIFHRGMMMAQGTCSAAEYQRMVSEKMTAAQLSATALVAGRGAEAALRPYLSRARANHRRLAGVAKKP